MREVAISHKSSGRSHLDSYNRERDSNLDIFMYLPWLGEKGHKLL